MTYDDADRRLGEVFKLLAQTFPQADFLADDLLDIVWLAPRVGPQKPIAAPAAPVIEKQTWTAEEPRPRSHEAPASRASAAAGASPESPQSSELEPSAPAEVAVHPDAKRDMAGGDAIPAIGLPIPEPHVLSDGRAIARALRPLSKQSASVSEWIFDETATAERYAEQKVFESVMVPAPSRWLRVELLVERTPSMRIWNEAIENLRRVLERHSAFRNIRSWNLRDRDGTLEILTWARRPRVVSWRELTDPSAPQLVIVASDCVSSAWSDGRMGELLGTWSGRGPVAVIQVLPQSLWHQTGLGNAMRTMLRATIPSAPNNTLSELTPVQPEWDADPRTVEEWRLRTVKLPVATLNPADLTRWASLVAATGGATAPGYLIPRRLKDDPPPEKVPRVQRTAKDRVREFDEVASRDARRLARYFAAATFPLTPPVMRFIRSVMIPMAANSAIAEIVVGGLMHVAKIPEHSEIESELIQYDFPQEVRERLLDGANWSDLLRMIQLNASKHVDPSFGSGADFGALLAGRDAAGDKKIPAAEEPLTHVGLTVLDRLGGEHRKFADDLRSRKEPRQSRLRTWSDPAHPRRTRVELAAYLAHAEAMRLVKLEHKPPSDFGEWIAGLHRWGLPVLLEAALTIANEVTDAIEDEKIAEQRKALIEAARRHLREQSMASADDLTAAIAGTPVDQRDSRLAAEVVASVVGSEHPSLRHALERVAEVVKIATDIVPPQDLRNAITARLISDLLGVASVVPDLLPDRPTIAVAGTRAYELPDVVQWTATEVGRALARSGHHLLSGGRQGVDHLVARAFTAELEFRGIEPKTRLLQLVSPGTRPDFDRGEVIPVSESRWNDECVARCHTVIAIAGSDHVESLANAGAWNRRTIFPLRWTGGTSAKLAERAGMLPRFGRPKLFDEQEPRSRDEVRLLVSRLLAWTLIGTEHAVRDSWVRYTDLLRTLITEQLAITNVEYSAPRLHALLQSLQTESPASLAIFSHDVYIELESLAATNAQWLVHDLLALAEVEPHAVRNRDKMLEQLGAIAYRKVPELTRTWLTRRLLELRRRVPVRQLDGVLAVARGAFGSADEVDRWTREHVGLRFEDAAFRAGIRVEAFRAIDTHLQASSETDSAMAIEVALRNLVGVLTTRPQALSLMRSSDAASRVLGYLLLQAHLEKLRLKPLDLAEILMQEGQQAAATSEIKPLRQLLLALHGLWQAFDDEGKRLLARSLAAAHAQLQKRPAADPRKAARNYIRSALKSTFQQAASANAAIDRSAARHWNRLRGKITSTRIALPPTVKVRIGTDEITFLLQYGNHAQRVFAVSFAVTTNRPEATDAVAALIEQAASRGELHVGCAVAASIADQLTSAQRRRLADALTVHRNSLKRGRLAADIDRTIARLTSGP